MVAGGSVCFYFWVVVFKKKKFVHSIKMMAAFNDVVVFIVTKTNGKFLTGQDRKVYSEMIVDQPHYSFI